MLDVLPIGVIVFPGSGISANLADKARKMGIPAWRFSEEGGAEAPGIQQWLERRSARRSQSASMRLVQYH